MSHSFRSIVLDDVGSTNTDALARAAAGEPGPLWVMARRQTKGRGRSGRAWTSDPGNLYASLLQRLRCPPSAVHQLSLLAGVAVVDAIRDVAAAHPLPGLRLKWPNDVLIDGAKCAGILPESQHGGSSGEVVVVIGIGINLSSHPEDLGRPATHLAMHGISATPDAMLAALDGSMTRWLQAWDCSNGFAAVRAAWLERGGPVGEPITVNTGSERTFGNFLGLDGDGALLLRDHMGNSRRVAYGDVSLGTAGGGQD